MQGVTVLVWRTPNHYATQVIFLFILVCGAGIMSFCRFIRLTTNVVVEASALIFEMNPLLVYTLVSYGNAGLWSPTPFIS
jgi:hypothetical protein